MGEEARITRRPWIICGAIFLNTLLMIAVFSLGVYVGRYGLSREGLVYTSGPAPQPAQPAQPDNITPRPNQPQQEVLACIAAERPQVLGRLRNISRGALEIAIEQGSRPVLLDDQTTYEHCDGSTLTLRDLRPGMVIAVYGVPSDDGRNLIARRVIVLSLPPDHGGD